MKTETQNQELKTLKDLEKNDKLNPDWEWVKEDWNFIINSESKYVSPEAIVKKWMKRLDITEEDLR